MYVFELDIPYKSLARRQGASIDNVGGILLNLLAGLTKRRAGKGHQTGPGGLKNTERTDQLEERVNTVGLGGARRENMSQLLSKNESGQGILTPRQCSCWC